jgi:anti-sigma factor RsiW
MKYQEDVDLSKLIKTRASYYESPQGLREKLSETLGRIETPEVAHWTKRWSAWQQWFGVGIAFACGAMFSIVVTILYGTTSQQDRILAQITEGHVRSLMVAHLSDVASSDKHTVKPWFSGKLNYSPPVKDLAGEGFPLVGGRLDYMDEQPVAALVYKHQLHAINVFVWPVRGKIASSNALETRQGFNIASWQDEGMQFWAVSDLNAADLQKFAGLMRTM